MTQRGYRDEYLDADDEPEAPQSNPLPRVTTSARGAGPMGFTGTVLGDDAEAAGLTEMPGDSFGGGATEPMLPGTWMPEEPHPNVTHRKETP